MEKNRIVMKITWKSPTVGEELNGFVAKLNPVRTQLGREKAPEIFS
jgi:hypothetical protein